MTRTFDLSQGFNTDSFSGRKRPVWYTHSGPQFRDEKFCDEVEGVRIAHTGWYTDSNGDRGTLRGIVARLSHGRFITGYYSSENGERVYFPEVYEADDELKAAYDADREAQMAAEKEMEYNNRWQAKRDIEDKLERKLERLRECLALRNDPGFSGYIRELAITVVEKVRKLRKELEEYNDVE